MNWRKISLALLATAPLVVFADEKAVDYAASARMIAQKSMLIDTHIDLPYRLDEHWADVTQRTESGEFDYDRARRGGLNIPFMSIYTSGSSEEEGTAYSQANGLIDRVEALVGRAPKKFTMVRNSAQAEKARQLGLMGLALGMENGSPIDGKIENVQFFRDRGISYITLAHSVSNHLSDSSYDDNRPWKGLSPFGKEVVKEMNRLGIMVDVSHLSDDAFWQIVDLSETPPIASHSSPRHFTPGFERNISDEMITALAEKGGVVMINFGSSFLTKEAREYRDAMSEKREVYLAGAGLDDHSPEAEEFAVSYREKHPYPYAALQDVVAAFQHVIDLVGSDHVGIGSDFDGVGDSLPEGMKDVSFYPALIEEFLKLGYSQEDIEAMLGGNLMRVWRAVDKHAQELAAASAS